MIPSVVIWIVAPDRTIRHGFFRTRLVKGGPWVAVRCWLEDGDRDDDGALLSDQITHLEVDGAAVNPFAPGYTLSGEPISEAEFRYLRAMASHARAHEPAMPEASPRRPVDFNTLHFDF